MSAWAYKPLRCRSALISLSGRMRTHASRIPVYSGFDQAIINEFGDRTSIDCYHSRLWYSCTLAYFNKWITRWCCRVVPGPQKMTFLCSMFYLQGKADANISFHPLWFAQDRWIIASILLIHMHFLQYLAWRKCVGFFPLIQEGRGALSKLCSSNSRNLPCASHPWN